MKSLKLICFLLLGLAGANIASAQSSGTITGTVTDASGAIVPKATVTARSASTGVETTRITNDSGVYVLVVPPGDYRVKGGAQGFQSIAHERITVDALASISLDFSLTTGSTTDEVTVTSASDGIQTENASLGTTLRNEVYAALPLAMSQGVPRDPTSFIGLAPGVASVVLQSAGPSYTSFNGGQQEVNGLYFEGLPISFPNQQGDTRPIALAVSVDAVNQFQVEINGQKAEWQGQGFHNYVIKSGADQFHGSIFEFFRNTALDSRNYFASFVPPDHQNEFGGNISGPLKRGKIWFFGNVDAYVFNTATAPTLLSIPSLAQRAGDFSALPTPIYDPATQTCTGSVCTKTQFPGNIIPASRISAVSQSLASYLPNPTGPGFINNYVNPLSRSITNKNTTERVDVNLTENHRFYGVFAYGTWRTDYTGNLTPTGTALPLPYTQTPGIVIEKPLIVQLHDTYTFSPSLLNTFGIGATRLSIPILSVTADGAYPQKAGLNGLPGNGQAALGFPGINFSGPNAHNNWAGTGPFNEWENSYTVQDSIDWVHGSHIFRFGGTYQNLQDNRANPASGSSASFTFSNNVTAGFSPTGTLLSTTGNAYASYLLGGPDSASIVNNTVVETGSRFQNFSLFAQDDWKVTPKLTLNLGVRWDVYFPFNEQHGRFSFMDPTLPNPAAGGIPGALVYGKQLVPTHWNNVQPRIGLAYSLDDKTVIRAGFLITNTMGTLGLGGNGPNGPGQNGFNPPSGIATSVTGQPVFYWQNGVVLPQTPFPTLSPGFGAGNSTVNPTGAIAPPALIPDIAGKSPEHINWSFGFQRQLPGSLTFGLTYSASVAHFLPRFTAVGMFSNSMPIKYLALGSLLNSQATPSNIALAQAQFPEIAMPFSNFKGTIATMLAPFPQYASPTSGGITCYSCNFASSNYNSMQVTVSRRLSDGITTQFAYTWAKEIDNINGTASQLGAVTGGTRNPYDQKLDRGLGLIDHRHNLHWTGLYQLPFGKGRLGGSNPILRKVIGGWSVTGIFSFVTGMPMGVTGNGCQTPGIVSTCMVNINPNFVGNIYTAPVGSSLNRSFSYINKSAFSNPAPYTFGNVPRSAPFGLTAPTNWEIDTTLRKTVPIRERAKFEFAADIFNLVNNVVFSAPQTNIDSSNFGTVTSTQNQARRIQLSARLSF
ncbi:TonB-dependent receptor [Edaphobacter albus]|uniref:TonB-dependent receptor n=1 Tax=Edaphobacter sp. 4G125 TaxID=2763071 RepID=UPI001644B7B2|nr:TonB-dependent receptor [Edaphobacter sp. 4G125]QNI35833.1 TonB-dependent receptor [Edaphobacter sp. 4G125]